ncbi:AI-2E family transporter [Crassaminicella profunda]|uniref:AI-2E family transporter n=1 Tax=Crassaminicella profunda TaxID=1286698 RepID=UPI001CA6725B|nr:AI-2E family transporter [Crassaminicella profunda]QZY54514.1 AI-2E family transporter [Crassaminicella profunda]
MENSKHRFRYIEIMSIVISSILLYLFFTVSSVRMGVMKVIKPIVIAFAIAYILDGAVSFLEKKLKWARGKSVFCVLIVLLLLMVCLGAIAIPNLVNNISEFLQVIPESFEGNDQFFDELTQDMDNESIKAINDYIENSLQEILTKISKAGSIILKQLLSKIYAVTSGVFGGIVSFVVAIYMLLDKRDLLARMKRLLYAFVDEKKADYILYGIEKGNDIFSSFVIGKMIDSAIIGLLCFVILFSIGVPYASIIALVVGATNMIPYFGPFIGGVPAVLITLLTSPKLAIGVAITIVLLQQFDGLILGPKILGDKVGVGAFWIIIAVTTGGAIGGVAGMFLGVPVLVLVKTLLEEDIERRLKLKNMDKLEVVNLSENNDKKKKKRFCWKS